MLSRSCVAIGSAYKFNKNLNLFFQQGPVLQDAECL